MKTNKITFSPANNEIAGVFDPPRPAAQCLPEWYKRQPGSVDNKKEITDKGDYNHTVRHCMPAFDAMSAGYVIPLPQDIEVGLSEEDGTPVIKWPSDIFKQFSSHSLGQISELPLDTTVWEPTPWKFHNPWVISTPPGYSCLFVTPMWHEDLPFRCFSGVVDTDVYCFQPVNFPCVFKRGFTGLIPMGTPMIQVIPFKRKEWELEIGKAITEKEAGQWHKSKRTFGHRYKKDYRQKKRYR